MFGLKLKSWMEAHLGRPHRQKSTSSTSGTSINTSSHHPASSSQQKRAGAPKDIISASSCSSTTNSTTSSSNGSTSTAIGVGAGSLPIVNSAAVTNIGGNNSPASCNFQATVNTSSSTSFASSSVVEPVTGSVSAQQQEIKIGKYCGDGGGGGSASTGEQKGETIGTKDSELHLQPAGETDPDRRQQQQQQPHQTSSSIIPASNNRVSTVSTSVSNSTSILSGGSSFCNSLSSPDTGYSTDGYSPKSVYPALSFSTETHAAVNKISSAASSKSSYTISSLVSNELLHSSSGDSKHTSASCSVQDGLNENTSESGAATAAAACFPKGSCAQHHNNYRPIPENDSTETFSKENQVMMRVDDDEGEQHSSNKKAIQLELEQKPPPSGTVSSVKDPPHSHSKFSPFSIDFLKRSSSSNANNDGNEDESGGGGGGSKSSSHGRTHRRAESMDARTPSHEDYKPLVDEEVSNPSSHFMTTIASSTSSGAALTTKSIRTSFVLSNSGQLVEFSSYKNAFSICSPRRERTRIKTNPWIIVSNNKSKDVSSSKSESANNKSTHANAECTSSGSNNSGSDVETEKGKMSSGGEDPASCSKELEMIPLETEKAEKSTGSGSKRVNLLEINNKKKNEEQREEENFMEDETGIVDHDSDDRSSSAHILYRISSASDSGKGSLVETNRNSTESSCLLSEDSTRNSIISQEASGSSCCGRSSSGESISQHHHHHHQPEDTLGHASSSCSPSAAAAAATAAESGNQKEQQKGHFHQNKNGDQGQRTFRNASVATTTELLVKSASVSVGVGTTGSNKSATKQHPVMVDKETDILSDWATNTDLEDTEDDLETDREGGNNDDNETVTPAPSSPGTDVDRALFSQSSSGTTDIDFGDSSAATQASSTQVFPPSSLLRQHQYPHNSSSSTYANTFSNQPSVNRFHNGSNSQSESCSAENYDRHYHLQQQQHNLNINNTACYTSVVPIVRPVLAAVQQQQQQEAFAFDLVNHHHNHTLQQQQQHPFQPANMFYPNFTQEDDLLEDDYPQVKQSSGHKGLARGALGFLRKIFKKGACSSQRHSPDSLASGGKKSKGKGKSDNNLTSLGVGMGSPLLTISEPLSNPRYSAAVLTTKKQMNPALNGCYFLTPTPNSFRRRSGGGNVGGLFGTQSDSNNSGSDSKGSSNTSKQQQQSKSVKTDIIRLPPQGPLSPQQSIIQPHHQRATSSSHSSASSSSCSALSSSNNSGIPQQCSTFLPHAAAAAPIVASYFPVGSAGGNNSNLIATISQQSNSASNTNNSSTSSSVHSLMSTSTCSGNNRPPSQSKTPIPITQSLYANSQNPITCSTNSKHSTNPFSAPNNSVTTARSPPPVISENSPYLNGDVAGMGKSQQSRRDIAPSLKGIIPPYESSPRLPTGSTSAAAAARMNSPCFNNSYSPIHRLVVTGGSHLRGSNPQSNNLPSTGLGHFPSTSSGESPLPVPRYSAMDNNSNNFATQVINRSQHPTTSMSQSPLINHRSSPHPQQQYPPPVSSSAVAIVASSSSSSQQQQPTHNNFFASPSPILKNPRYQYITSSNQNSPILNATKRLNGSTTIIMPSANNGGGTGPSGPPPLLTTFTPLPSSLSQRESLINNNNSTNTIAVSSGGGRGRQVVSASQSYNEFESRQQTNFSFQTNKNNGTSPAAFTSCQPTQQQLFQNHHNTHQQNHYYSSPIVKQRALQHQFEQTLWNNNEGGSGEGTRPYQNLQQQQYHQQQKAANQNLRFNSFLVRHRQLPQFYHTQWGLQERIYETVDSEDEQSSPGRASDEIEEQDLSMPMYNQQTHNKSGGMATTSSRMKHSYSLREGGFFCESNQVNGEDFLVEEERPTKRSKPKSLSASGRPFPRPVVALPMMPAGTFLSETETRLLESDKESDRKYKRLINEAEALLKEISVEKEKRAAAAAAVGVNVGGSHQQRDNNSFRLEECPQSDPLRRKAYDCWALRRLQQELAGCCASPPVLHRSRLNLQSPSTPTLASNPYLSHFQNMGMSTTSQAAPVLPQQVPYMSSGVDPNQNSFEF